MEPFATVDTSAMRWIRSDPDSPVFELRAGDALVGRLTRVRHGGSLAHAETSEGEWTIKRTGFLHPQVTLRKAGSPVDQARLDVHWRRTVLRIRGVPSLTFERAGLAVPAWRFVTSAGENLVHIEPVREGRRLSGGAITVVPAEAKRPELWILLFVGWYYILQEWFEDEAVAAAEAVLEVAP
jgi:hypothetical protein